MGLTSASQATGMLAGTLGAGLLVRWFDWEAVFLGRIPFTVLALALGVWWMGRGQRVSGERAGKRSFDLAGAVTLFGALTCLVIGLRLARSTGWVSPGPLALLLLAPLLLAGFWWTEGRVPWAILPRELLRIRGFLVSGGATFLAHLGVFVIWFIFPFYVEDSLGRGPAALGAMLAVMAGLNIGFSIMGGWLCDRTGPKAVGVTGLIVLAAGLFVMGFLEGQSTVGQVAASIALVGGGMGLFQSSAYSLMMGSVPAERFGTAAAALSLAQAFGTVLSVSVTGGLFALRSGFHLDGLAAGGLTQSEMEARAFILAFRDVFWLGAVIVVMGAFTYLVGGAATGLSESGFSGLKDFQDGRLGAGRTPALRVADNWVFSSFLTPFRPIDRLLSCSTNGTALNGRPIAKSTTLTSPRSSYSNGTLPLFNAKSATAKSATGRLGI